MLRDYRRLALLVLAMALVVVVPAATSSSRAASGGAASFTVRGAVATPLTLTIHDLRALPQHSETVTFQAGPTVETHTFRGPLLTDVLALAGPQFDPTVKNDLLRFAVAATGSDGYRAIVAYGDIDPSFGATPVLLAIKQDGQLLRTAGPRLVVPGDIKGGRYVSNVVDISLVSVDAAVDG